MIKKLLSAYVVDYPKLVAYLWQSSEYRFIPTMTWWGRITDFRKVAYRGDLVKTSNAKLLRIVCVFGAFTHLLLSLLSILLFRHNTITVVVLAVGATLLYSFIVVIYSALPIWLYSVFIQAPRRKRAVAEAKEIFAGHPGIVIAVAGSYGKTTMKELLAQVLGSELNVAYTAGNRNVLSSIASFAKSLTRQEDVVIVEFGEGAPGDVALMTDMVDPDYAVITGLAPNHLDKYITVDAIAEDFRALTSCVGVERVLLNGDSKLLVEHLGATGRNYTEAGFDGWIVSNTEIGTNFTSFSLVGHGEKIELTCGLVGRHNIGPIVAVVSLAMDVGITKKAIKKTFKNVKPYEHRLEPKSMHGAWLVDDAYNGNIDGIQAGLGYLKEIKVDGRKFYVTSGLVDQGDQTAEVHNKIGNCIAETNPDKVFLMKNSVTDLIAEGIKQKGYDGEIKIIDRPLEFYGSIESILAKGDVILVQNDWPDNYA